MSFLKEIYKKLHQEDTTPETGKINELIGLAEPYESEIEFGDKFSREQKEFLLEYRMAVFDIECEREKDAYVNGFKDCWQLLVELLADCFT